MQRHRQRKSRAASATEGIPRAQGQKGVLRSYVDSWSHAAGIICNDMSGQNSLEPTSSLPERKLRADELSKEVEPPKRRSPNVIARLMGLEALPSPKHVQTHQENAVESHQYDCRSTRKCSSKHLEFKDVYEDLEAAAHIANRSCSSKGQTQSILIEPESAHVGNKLKVAKHLFGDENFQYAANELEVSSNPRDSDDLFVQYLQPTDNMFLKHIHFPEAPPGSYIAVLKPEKYQEIAKPWRLGRDAPSCRHSDMSHTKRLDGLLLEPHNRHRARVARKSARAPLEDTDEGNILSLPTRIVVLKPNVGKIKNDSSSESVGSHRCPHSIRKMEGYNSVGGYERMSNIKNDSNSKVRPSRLTSKESREIARRIARKMRNSSYATKGIKSTPFIGYAGDESSYDPDETDTDSESEVVTLSSTKSFYDSNLSRYSSPTLVGPSSNKEAKKKRLPEKLKTTLGEMLSLPDVDSRSKHLLAKGLVQTNNRVCDDKQNANPLGISSSRDGWPNGAMRLHPHSVISGRTDLYESSPCSITESARQKSIRQENFTPRISNSRGEASIDETGSSSDAIFKTQMAANTRDILEDPHTCKNHGTSVFRDVLKEKPNHQDSPSTHNLGDEPESSASTRDNADHHSPISILEVPLVEDPPFSESFERVSAELHELRKQLKLLKMESGSFTDSSNLDEVDQTSPNASQEFASENCETPYGPDLLINSGLEESYLDMLGTTWDSQDCPFDPKLLFDKLKRNYSNEMGSSRSERRLLFDMINLQISEIFQNHSGPYPWVTPKLSGSCLKSKNEAVRDAFEKLLNQDFSNRAISSNIVLDREMQWPDMKGEINAIGNEIANSLADDMIADVICKLK